MTDNPANPQAASDAPSAPPAPRIALDPQVSFSPRQYGGQTSWVANHAGLGKYFRIGQAEYRIATLLNGERSISEIHQQLIDEEIRWPPEDVAQFAAELVKQKLAIAKTDSPSDDPAATQEPPAASPVSSSSLLQTLPRYLSLVISQRFPLIHGESFAKKLVGTIGPLFSIPAMIAWAILVGSSLFVVYGHFDQFSAELSRLFDAGIWIVLIAFWCFAKVIHEAGHAICAKRHGVRIGKVGIMFFLFAPLAYVDVSDAWKLKSRWKRVQIALAGVYLELAIAAIAAWVWWFLPDGMLRHLSAQLFLVAGPTTLLVNANPLLRLDGYYVVSDLLEIPNLRMHGRAQLGARIERTLFAIEGKPSRLHGWRRPAATFHAFCSVIFQFFWMGGLVFAASMWFKGLGIVIAVCAFLLWALIPLVRWCIKIWFRSPGGRFGMNTDRRRLLGYAALLSFAVQYLCTAKSPFDRRVPVVVQFQDEQIARATADAFVDAVFVHRGQRVASGMVLMELSQPELVLKREQIADDLAIAQQKAVQHRNRQEMALAASAKETAESLQRRLAELTEQIAGLNVVAQRDGVVTSTDPDRLLGRYVKTGDELVRISDPKEKELLAVVSQSDMAAYQKAIETSSESYVRLRGGITFQTSPSPLRPRARRTLPHPALSASVGGPLAVEPSADSSQPMQLIEAQMESVTPLDPLSSTIAKAGQLGTMTISDDRSLVARLYDHLMQEPQPMR